MRLPRTSAARTAVRPRHAAGGPAGGASRIRQVVAGATRRGRRRAAAARRARSAGDAVPIRAVDDRHRRRPTCSAADADRLAECIEDAARRPAAHRRRPHPRPTPIHEAAQLVDGLIIDAERDGHRRRGGARRARRAVVDARPADRRRRRRQRPGDRHGPRPVPPRPGADPDRHRLADGPRRQRGRAATARAARAGGDRPARPGTGHRPPPARPARRARASSTAPSRPASRCAGRSPAGSTSPPRRRSDRLPSTRDRRRAGRRAGRARPADRGHRPAARRRRPRAGDADGDGAQRVGHRHRRAPPDAQPARPPRPDDRAGAAAAAAARLGDPSRSVGSTRPRRHRPGGGDGRRRRPPVRRRVAIEAAGPASPKAAARRPCASPSETLVDLGDGEEPHVRPRLRGARRVRRDVRCPRGPPARRRVLPRRGRGLGGLRRVRPGPGLPAGPRARRARPARPATTRRSPSSASCSARRTCPTPNARGRCWSRGSCCSTPTASTAPTARFVRVTDIGYVHDNPRLIAAAAWGRALSASPPRRPSANRCAGSPPPRTPPLGEADDVLGVPFLCDAATMLGALGELDLATTYLERAIEPAPGVPRPDAVDGVRPRRPPGHRSATSTSAWPTPSRSAGGG